MSDENDQHPSLREHLGLRERVTVLEGGQANILATLNRIEARQLAPQAQPQVTSELAGIAAAMHRVIDERSNKGGNNGFASGLITGGVMLCVAVVAFLIGKLFF